MNNESKGMLLGILGVVSFGLTLPATRFVIPYLDPIFVGLGRAVIAAIFAAALLIITKQPIPNKNQFYRLVIIAMGVVIGFPVFSAWAMQTVPASHGGVVLGVLPLATAIVAVLISRERPSLGFWVSGVVGGAIVIVYSLLNGAGSFQIGNIALLGAIVSAAIGYAFGGQLSKEMGGWQVICWALLISLPFTIGPAWIHSPVEVLNIPVSVWFGFLYLALVSQLLGFFLWYKGLALGGVARVSQTQLIQPFVTILASALLINEFIDVQTIVFSLLIVSTVIIGKKMPIYEKSK
ncbi:MAG: EamA family transporter [Gammaproteobacteria bacterium]|nr:DMT family transporter [bacterium AH-315-E07]PCH61116.1 MAG: EamA family transporter [Gammaproteobacteria bacterium]